jgi:hypothetical protein
LAAVLEFRPRLTRLHACGDGTGRVNERIDELESNIQKAKAEGQEDGSRLRRKQKESI